MRQHPSHALATAEGKEKTRKPIDPPPIVQMDVDERADPNRHYLFSPHLFAVAALLPEGADTVSAAYQKNVIGETCSAIHRLKDTDNKEGGFFVFGDISVRKPGRYRLHFSLFNNDSNVSYTSVAETISDIFTVYSSKDFTGMEESTPISRSFNEQGVRLRMRKEPRSRQVAHHQPDPEQDHALASHHYSNYAQLSQPRNYATQPVYHTSTDDRGVKRRREEDNDLRVTPSQIPRTAYYTNPYQSTQQPYAGLAMQGQPYTQQPQQSQHYMPPTMHQPSYGHHYFNNQMGHLDPDIFK